MKFLMDAKQRLRIIALVCILIALALISAFGQISPGDLTTAHADLEGMSKCVQCHELGKHVTNAKCLDCHKEINTLINADRGYHASVEVKGKDCFECHNEHHGRKFEIVRFDDETFNHNLTGYKLEGKHAETKCLDCHKAEFIKVKATQRKSGDSYLGLETSCLSCHQDYHQETLGNDCAKCHGFDSFRPAPGFNHNETSYKLVGAHAKVDCGKCHKIETRNNKEFQQFKGVVANNCIDCHKDEHNGRFGNDCLKCHTNTSFKQVKNLDNFDHSKTDFPLLGMHQNVDCKSCHKKAYTVQLPHQNCIDCHEDYHNGQFAKNGILPDCNQCHTVNGFSSTLYTIEQHNQTSFKLEGAHLATPCLFCHKKTEQWKFRQIGQKCVDCHEDIHKDAISAKYYPEQNCENCHTVESFSGISFDHKLTSFPLEGAHKNQTCRACHFNENNEQKFAVLSNRCDQCHADMHGGQFKTKYDNACELCHVNENWEPLRFEHDSTRFKLDGRHKDVECFKCHKPVENENYINYTFEEVKCALCHAQ